MSPVATEIDLPVVGLAPPPATPSSPPGNYTTSADANIKRYLTEHNDDPKPFVWTKPAGDIFAKLNRLPEPSV